MTIDLKPAIFRILDPSGETTDTGFVVTVYGLIVTCAHVVKAAGAGPGDSVDIIFHRTGEARKAIVECDWWRNLYAEGVTILRLEGPLPEGEEPPLLGSSGVPLVTPSRTSVSQSSSQRVDHLGRKPVDL